MKEYMPRKERPPGRSQRTNFYMDMQDKDKSYKKSMQKMGNRRNEVGNSRRTAQLIMEGSNDRMNAVLYEPQKYDNPQEQGAYCEGFIIHGTRRLSANLRNLSPEELYNIGYNDCISGIGLDALPKIITTNIIYIMGYNAAKERNEGEVFGPSKLKHR